MRSLRRFVLLPLGLVLLVLGGAYAWASLTSGRLMARTIASHEVDFPIPFPLDAEEIDSLGLDAEGASALAMERALERGQHLLAARYPCADCHGEDFGGGVMVDAFPLGTLLGPNLTRGAGGVVTDYTPADWDRAVRHGILPDGRPSFMPAGEFLRMSDQELSDIIAYIRSLPPVDREVPPPSLGPLGKVLVATGQLTAAADLIPTHDDEHPEAPPAAEVGIAFGEHLTATCTGCHNVRLTGGPIMGGDPAWGPAANLTPHADGLQGWSYEDFRRAMQEGVRPDGRVLVAPMTFILPYAQRMSEVELRSMWAYLESLEGQPTGS